MAKRYVKVSKKQRGLMLDELCALTGYHRNYAIRLLRERALGPAPPKQRRLRERAYSDELVAALRKLWAVLDCLCGKRLAATIAVVSTPL